MTVKLSRRNVITALGLRFWIKAVEDLGIAEEVSKCVALSEHLQSVMSNNHQVEQFQNIESDDTFLVILVHGVHFWQQIVAEHRIEEVRHCNMILEYLQRAVNDFDINGSVNKAEEKVKGEPISDNNDLEDDFSNDNSRPLDSPIQTQNVLIKFKKTARDYVQKKGFREPKTKVLQCEHCEKAFSSFQQAETHMERKHPDLKEDFYKKNLVFRCERGCDKAFSTSIKLRKHYKASHSITQCTYCPEHSDSILSAVKHVREAHPSMKTDFDDMFRVYKCPEEGCDRKFYTGGVLREHRRRIHRGIDQDSSSTLCADCGMSFSTFKELKKHKKSHNKVPKKPSLHDISPRPCTICGETFIGIKKLYLHKFHVHDNNAIFCDDCGQKFEGKRNFERHRQMKHLKLLFECNLCGKGFNVKINLERHMRRMHSTNDERKHKCSECGKGFSCKATYEGHMNMHLGLKPFKCQFCGAGYQNDSNLLAHQRKSCKNNPMLQ